MGELVERAKLSRLVWSDYYKNSDYFAMKYKKSDEEVMSIPLSNIKLGEFYFLHYNDAEKSNWMRYSPIFTVGWKKVKDLIIVFAVNLNFIPIEMRVEFFDKYMQEETFDKNIPLAVDFKGVYEALLKLGFEYAIVEYVVNNVLFAHKIHMQSVPRFLFSGHPENKYDPKKLYDINLAKRKDKLKRHEEMSKLMLSDLIEINEEISEKFVLLKEHISRVRNNIKK